MASVTLDALTFELADFVGDDGLGHAQIMDSTVGGSGEEYEAEALFPDRIFGAMLNQLSLGYFPTVVSVTGATKTLALTDGNTIQECNRATAQAITIPANASVAYQVGTTILFEQHGAGQVTVTGAGGVTVNGVSGGSVAMVEQYKGFYIRKTATNTWIAIGAIT